MTRKLATVFVLGFLLATTAFGQDVLNTVRAKFYDVQSEEDLHEIIQLSSGEETLTPYHYILQAYRAASIARQADFTILPHKKLHYFQQGKALLEASIALLPALENRYLRLVLQLKAPKMLNYNKNISHDLLFVTENITTADLAPVYKQLMKETLLSSTEEHTLVETINAIKIN